MENFDRSNKEHRFRELILSRRGAKMERYAEIIGLCAAELARDRSKDSVAAALENVILQLSSELVSSTNKFTKEREEQNIEQIKPKNDC